MSFLNGTKSFFKEGMKRKLERQKVASGSAMSFLDHVQELRKLVVSYLIQLALLCLITFFYMEELIAFLRTPYEAFQKSHGLADKLMSISLFEVVSVNFRICLMAAFVLSLPLLMRQIWLFIEPALFPEEKKIALPIICAALVMFYLGITFGFYVIVPALMSSALEWAQNYATIVLTVQNYFDSLLLMLTLFGIIFEVPVIMSLLGLAGLISSNALAKNRRVVLLVSFVVGALLSPPDVISQSLVSVPLYLMSELSIVALRYIEKNRGQSLDNLESSLTAVHDEEPKVY